ncbi:glycosyltransferase [Stutzerimonas stutzeri]|uniref:glycosyltransferase n=1 Tax=Stutzerimonas stutzeri TaxID=316 RepID=UPI002232B72D|nr:glycosyltransferase [Stutzerimonas stutzeri]GBC58925.1 glycosyltransferase [Stutzerimonas stutzeri]
MKVLLVVDTPQWAFGSIAENLRRGMEGVEVSVIFTSGYDHYEDFLTDLKKPENKSDLIHFFWRDYLLGLLDFVSNVRSEYQNIFIERKITTHVPDHLFVDDDKEIETRISLFKFVDGYFVTSRNLQKEYSNLPHIPKPHSVIHDNPLIEVSSVGEYGDRQALEVVWVGNSKWGEYLGYSDYKGLAGIVKPAIERLKAEGFSIMYHEFDKASRSAPREEVLDTMARADVVLISSLAEGTPLPLIEAMAHRCAVVTTDVGIAREVLPPVQQPFIIDRTVSAMYEALSGLGSDRLLLEQLKNQNFVAYREHFSDPVIIGRKWKKFFDDVQSTDRSAEKEKLFSSEKRSILNRAASDAVGYAVRLSRKAGFLDVARKNRFLMRAYINFLAALNKSTINYDPYDETYKSSVAGRPILALYSPYWPGVANSTASFFKESSIAYPLFSKEYPNVKEHVYLERIIEILSGSAALKCVVLSGGALLQMEMAKRLKQRKPKLKVFFGWHGSPAQWVDYSQYQTFHEWKRLYDKRVVDGFLSFKPELDSSLESLGIHSHSVRNFVVDSPYLNTLLRPSVGYYKIGLFAAMFSWYKNPFPQMMAIAKLGGAELTTNLKIDESFSWIADHIDLREVQSGLSNRAFMSLLSQLHVVLYVTNTECSPMIALESVAVLTPCVVGPAGNIYKGHPKLERHLVVNEVDNPAAITRKLEHVRQNYQEIKGMLKDFKVAYNRDLTILRESIMSELMQ